MSFFGMGAWEMMIILVAALVIFGPGKLPEVAGQAGRAVRDFRRMTSELSGEFEKTIAEVTDTKGTLGNDLKGMAGQVNSVTKSVKKDLTKATSSTASKTPAKSTSTKSTSSSTTPKSSTTAAASRTTTSATSAAKSAGTAAKATATPPAPKVASKADPLADLFFSEEDTLPASSPKRATTVAAPKPKSTTSSATAPSAGQAVDAVARARQRRLSAGYNSHRTP